MTTKKQDDNRDDKLDDKVPSTDNDDTANDNITNRDPDYFEFEFSLKRLDYKKYLVGKSTENFLASCGCDDKADVAGSSTINQTAHAYRRYIYHLCAELNMNTDQVVKKFKKLHRFSYELEDIIKQKCMRLRAESSPNPSRPSSLSGVNA